MLRSWPESLPAHQVHDDALLNGQALRLVDGEGEACYNWELRPGHARPLLPAEHGQQWYPFGLVGVESRATGQHFNLPGHSMHNMKLTVIEKVKSDDPLYGREREKLMIRKFNSFYSGINKEP